MEREEAERLAGWAARVLEESRAHLLKAERELVLAAAAAVEHRHRRRGGQARRRPHKIVVD